MLALSQTGMCSFSQNIEVKRSGETWYISVFYNVSVNFKASINQQNCYLAICTSRFVTMVDHVVVHDETKALGPIFLPYVD